MRVALFFDGKNFYSGWRDTAQGRKIDFPRLADWLVKRVHGDVLWGAHYYTGVEPVGDEPATDAQHRLHGFLDMLEIQPGYFVYRFPRKQSRSVCKECGAELRYSHEKEVDTTMVADMLRYAAVGAYDVAVLMSGDADYAPALEGVRAVGKQAYVASWAGAGVSQRVRRAAFEHIDLLQGMQSFVREDADYGYAPSSAPTHAQAHAHVHGPASTPAPSSDPEVQKQTFIDELKAAEVRFTGGYVGLAYFITRWRSAQMDANPDVRRRVLDDLVHEGLVEIYAAPDGAQALRSLH